VVCFLLITRLQNSVPTSAFLSIPVSTLYLVCKTLLYFITLIWRSIWIMKTLFQQIYLPSWHLLSLRTIYSPQHHVLRASLRQYFLKKTPDVLVNLHCASFCTCIIVIDAICNLNTSSIYDVYWCEVRIWNAAKGHEQPRGSCSSGSNVNQYNIHVTYSPFSRQFY
jgi:hypothetical protein